MRIKLLITILIAISTSNLWGQSAEELTEKHNRIAIRTIGDHLLLRSGDSTTRILPIQQLENTYELSFENEVSFDPEELIRITDEVFTNYQISGKYIVEVKELYSGEIIYTYEKNPQLEELMIPCKTRELLKRSYSIYFTLFQTEPPAMLGEQMSEAGFGKPNELIIQLIKVSAVILIFAIGFIFWKRHKREVFNPHISDIGKFKFDKSSMKLCSRDETIELTGKEADLLILLHGAKNETIPREDILNKVWGDEGDYVGRTLDVFISKLRKKLESDQSIKIINIRGVGYKLVLDEV